jgi:tRNA A-37 threonylcarbamoyl transferase component Bud32
MSSSLSEDSSPNDSGLQIDDSLAIKIAQRLDRLWVGKRPTINPDFETLVGRQIGNYRILELIGRGAFGVVYLAIDIHRDRKVAIKVPRHEVLVDVERLNRFVHEAELAAGLQHSGIVLVYESNFEHDPPFIAYAYCHGPDLGKWLSARKLPVAALQAASFVAQIADAVDFAHNKGVLHRDLKPGNILLEPYGNSADDETLNGFRPLLTDFGLARLLEGGLKETRSSLLVGTPNYLPPEQLLGEHRQISPSTDIYSLGVILFELVTLRTPFEGSTYVEVLDKLRTKQPPRLQSLNPDVPQDFEAICRKCLEKDPADRYQTAKLLREDLERFVSGKRLVGQNLGWWPDLRRWMRKPERLIQCGTVSLWAQIFTTLWTWTFFFMVWRVGTLDGYVARTAAECVLLCLTFSGPLIILGTLLARGRSWAFWPAFALLMLQFSGELAGMMSNDLLLSKLYTTVPSKLASYAMLLLASVFQLAIYSLSIPAWLRQRANFRSRPAMS